MSTPAGEEQQPPTEAPSRGLAHSAGLLSLGSAASRVLGLVREIVIASLFGATGMVSAFRVAAQVPILLYDFLVGGMLSAALIPVLSEYLHDRPRDEFERLVGVLFGLFTLVLTLIVVLLELFAEQVAWTLAAGFLSTNPDLLRLTTQLIRVVAPSVWLLSVAGLLTAVLYSLERFSFPALATAVYNLGIIIAAPLLVDRIGIFSLAVGIVAGALVQAGLMAFDLRRSGIRIRISLDWRHPAVKHILTLYAPIAVGLLVTIFQVTLDRRLASGTGEQSIAWMANATTLQQMPLGLISVAIALASLPRLSQYFASGDEASYRKTLGDGLRMVVLLIAPAAVLLWMLGEQTVSVLFERNMFTATDTSEVVSALNIYLIGMVFAAIDFPLNYAFYARHNTLLPAVVGVLSVGVYIVVAFTQLDSLGYLGLVWADTAKQASHALIMLALLRWRVGRLDAGIGSALLYIGVGVVAMGVAIAAVEYGSGYLSMTEGWSAIFSLIVGGATGVGVYVYVLLRFGVPEMSMAVEYTQSRIAAIVKRS